jgi:multiple sugar transport system permease protein
MSQSVAFKPPIPPAALTRRERRSSRPGKSQNVVGAWMVAPAFVLLAVFIIVPIALTFTLAFTNARLVSPQPIEFIGIDNFTRLLQSETFWKSLRNTFIFALFVVPIQAGLALGLAILINVKIKGVNFFRTVYFLPVVTSIVVVSMLWLFLYDPNGLINSVLAKFGIEGPNWLGNSKTALGSIIFMSIWQNVGFHMVIWLSGLQTIDGTLYEASSLDGATPWQQFKFVTWPGLKQTRIFILITITIAALSLFAQVNIMTDGGPLDSTTTVVYQAVRTGFEQGQTGYASAISLVFFVIVLIISLIQRYLTRDKEVR